MPKVVITQFSDPMMGLSWECEPMLLAVEQRFGDAVELRDAMGVLVRDARDFMTPEERRLPEAEGFERYNARLAQIYLSEQAIGGVPMNMDGFALFAPDRKTSEPLCLAYEAVRAVCPEKARDFLFRLREATVVACRPTTKVDEILRVVRACGIDEAVFLASFNGAEARDALAQDEQMRRHLGVWQLPAFLVSSGDQFILIPGVPGPGALERIVERLLA